MRSGFYLEILLKTWRGRACWTHAEDFCTKASLLQLDPKLEIAVPQPIFGRLGSGPNLDLYLDL